jgi:hypothetical protein
VDLELALGEALRVWSTKVSPEEMRPEERREYERLIEVYRRDRLAMTMFKEVERER